MTAIYATIGFFALLAVVWLGAALWMVLGDRKRNH